MASSAASTRAADPVNDFLTRRSPESPDPAYRDTPRKRSTSGWQLGENIEHLLGDRGELPGQATSEVSNFNSTNYRSAQIYPDIRRAYIADTGSSVIWTYLLSEDGNLPEPPSTPQPIGVWTGRMTLTGARERVAKKSYIRAGLYPNPVFDAHMEKCRARG